MKPPVTDWPEVDNYVLEEEEAQLFDNHCVMDAVRRLNGPPLNREFTVSPVDPELFESNGSAPAQTEGNGSYERWISPVERQVGRDTSLSMGTRLTYVNLCGYWGKNCEMPYPSVPTLARELGCCEETARGYIKELREAKLIKVVPRRQKGRFQSNGYELLLKTAGRREKTSGLERTEHGSL
jgi:hypothetical protein